MGSASSAAAVAWRRWLTQLTPATRRRRSWSSVLGSLATTATRRSGPSTLAIERTSAHRAVRGERAALVCRAGHQRQMVVLDHEHLRMGLQDLPERCGPLAVHARAGRVLRARRAHHRPCAVLEGGLERDRVHASLVEPDADGPKAHRGHDAGARQVAGILDGDHVAPDQRRSQQALDRVERSVRHRQAVRLIDVAGEQILGALAKRRQHRGSPVQRRVVGRPRRTPLGGRAAARDPDCPRPDRRPGSATGRLRRGGARARRPPSRRARAPRRHRARRAGDRPPPRYSGSARAARPAREPAAARRPVLQRAAGHQRAHAGRRSRQRWRLRSACSRRSSRPRYHFVL